jgi:hypothetical protein
MARDDDTSARGGSARYAHGGPGTGANEPKHHEKKEQREDWVPRQGGDQSRDPEDHGRPVDEHGDDR